MSGFHLQECGTSVEHEVPQPFAASMPRSRVDPKVQLMEQIRRDMGDNWRQDGQLLNNLFPVDPVSDRRYERAQKELINTRNKRWKGISANPRTLPSLHAPLTNLMNDILFHYGISRDDRLFLDTHIRHVQGDLPNLLSPGIFLAGIGPEFATAMAPQPRGIYRSGIAAFEVALDSQDLTAARDRLAVHAGSIFLDQDNRRFVYGLIITQNIFTLFMFDHSGAVGSVPLNYHEHPDQFCAVISGLAASRERIGFDDNLSRVGNYAKLRTFEPLEGGGETERYYRLTARIFETYDLVGRGTLCYLASSLDDPSLTVVVKDAWIAPADLAGRESEGSLLRHAQKQGLTTGIVQIHHFEEVRRSVDALDLDTVVRNRCYGGSSVDRQKVERVHTRIIMLTHGKTLDKFSTRTELLLAFHDAVLAHRKLYEIAGILHRDISVRNILINPEGVEGDCGILIDFDHAIRVGDTSPYSTKTRIGTYRYMSRNVLKERGQHTYLDDLESFYWVFCWILVTFERPGISRAKLPADLSGWDRLSAGTLKEGIFSKDFDFPVSLWFGTSLRDLATRLHDFFAWRDNRTIRPLSAMNPAKDYDEFISHIRQAVKDLGKEPEPSDLDNVSAPSGDNITTPHARSPTRECSAPYEPSTNHGPVSNTSRKRDLEAEDNLELATSSPPPRKVQRRRLAFPGMRELSRRSTANYNLPIAD